MRILHWTQFSAVGDGQSELSGTLIEFLLSGACSAIVYFRVVPPLTVVNNLLASGVSGMGMGGGWRWDPFTLTEAEYKELGSALVAAVPTHGLRAIQYLNDVPEWVKDELDLLAWLFYIPEPLSSQRRIIQEEILREENEQRQTELRDKLLGLEIQASKLWMENVDRRKCRVPSIRQE